MPERIQLKRQRGWRKPEGAIVVARPSKWGNPFPTRGDWITWTACALGYRADRTGRHAAAVALYRSWLTGEPVECGRRTGGPGALVFADGTERSLDDHVRGLAAWAASTQPQPVVPEPPDLTALRGHDLACWCPLDQPCHADILLDLANRPSVPSTSETSPDE